MWESFGTGGKIGMVGGIAGAAIGVIVPLIVCLTSPGDFGSKAGGLIFIIIFALVFFGIFFFAFRKVFGPMGKQRKLQKIGIPAEATILEVGETGITVNNIYPVVKLKLEVRPPGGQPYQAELQTIIERLDIPQFQPGTVLAVKYDPKDPSNVALAAAEEPGSADVSSRISSTLSAAGLSPADVSTALAAAGFAPTAPGGIAPAIPGAATGAAAWAASTAESTAESERGRQLEEFLKQADAENAEIRKTGQPASAVIVQAMPLGIFVNGNNPAMTFILEVKPEGQPSFQAQVTGVIGEPSVAKFQPGKTVFVKFDPADHTRVSLDHS
jgi:hypothetical protein